MVLGALIEEVTNDTYSSYMQKHVFRLLNMNGAAASKEIAYEKRLFNRLSVVVWHTKKKCSVL